MTVKAGLVFMAVCVLSSVAVASTLYKWKDADGVVHFSNVAPPETTNSFDEYDEARGQEAEAAVEEDDTSGSSSPRPAVSGQTAAKKDDGLSRSDCDRVVRQTREAADTHIATARDNMDKGHITREQYDKAKDAVMKIRNGISASECVDATGKDKEIYECLAESHGCIVCCLN